MEVEVEVKLVEVGVGVEVAKVEVEVAFVTIPFTASRIDASLVQACRKLGTLWWAQTGQVLGNPSCDRTCCHARGGASGRKL